MVPGTHATIIRVSIILEILSCPAILSGDVMRQSLYQRAGLIAKQRELALRGDWGGLPANNALQPSNTALDLPCECATGSREHHALIRLEDDHVDRLEFAASG